MQSAPRPPASFFDSLERGGRCTQIVGIRRPWLPDDRMLQAQRAAAQRGLRIERSFLLAHRSQQQEPRLVEQLKLDRDAGIETRLLYVGPQVEDLAATAPGGFEFGLWDDSVCGAFITGEGDAADRIVEWRESRDEETLGRARAFLGMLDDTVPSVASEPEGELPEDAVLLAAPVAEAASEGCHVDPETGKSCRSFHLPRIYFRIFGIIGGTWAHRGMYERGLSPLLRKGAQPRILISATADHSLYALLLWLARNAGAEPVFTVTDLCPTPLALTRWYADYVGGSVETVAADAVGFADRGPFDAICTHLFLGWIPADRRLELLKSWAALLRPGGRVVTNVGVRVDADAAKDPSEPRFGPRQVEAFEAAAVSRARAWKDFVGVAPEAIAPMAAQFLPNWRSLFEPNTPERLESMFDEAGFDLEMELAERVPSLRPEWNPAYEVERTTRQGRKEALLVAVRRGA